MKIHRYALVLLTALLSGCAAQVLHSQKSNAPTGDISKIDVIFVSKVSKSSHQQALGMKVVEKLPNAFIENGIVSEAKNLPPAEIPINPVEYPNVFGTNNNSNFILLITPIWVETSCRGICSSRFRVRTDLIKSRTNKVFWSATIDLPYPEFRGSNYSGVAIELTKTVLERLQADGFLPQKSKEKT